MIAAFNKLAELAIATAQITLIQRHIERERQIIAELASMRARWEREKVA